MGIRRTAKVGSVAAVALSAVALTACGGSKDSKSSSSTTSGTAKAATVDLAAANKILAPYTGHPSAFPVEKPLLKHLPAGSKVDYLQCVTPICGLFGQILPPAAKQMKVGLTTVKAGASADALQGAMSSIIAQKPSAVLIPAVEPDTINNQLKQLSQMKTPVTSNGVMNSEKYGIGGAMFNTATAEIAGKMIAAWVVKDKGAKADTVFYITPELSFNAYIEKAYKSELKQLCPSCKERSVILPVATIGSSAPSRVVSDLQQHGSTNVGVFGTEEAAVGLPAAMKTAGLKTTLTGFGPNPANLQDLKNGGLTSGVGLGFPVMVWTQLDMAVRLATGEPLTPLEQKGVPPLQMLESKDITFDPTLGFAGYPDFAKRFAKLWG